MKAMIVVSLVTVLLSGCAEYGVLRQGVAGYGAKAADETRAAAQWSLCNAITVGAWKRAYGNDPDKAVAWRQLCADAPKGTP